MRFIIELDKTDVAYSLAIEHRLSIYKDNTHYVLMNVEREINRERYAIFKDKCLGRTIRIGKTSTGNYVEPVAILEEERGIIPNTILARYPNFGVIFKDSIWFPDVKCLYTINYGDDNEEELKNKLEAKELIVKIRDGQLEGCKKHIDELNNDINRLKSIINSNNEKIKKKTITIHKLHETIDSNNELIAELREDIAFRDNIINNMFG